MFKQYLHYLKKLDWALGLTTFFLTAFGLVAIYSIEAASEYPTFLNVKKQLIFFAIGFGLMLLFAILDYRFLRTYSTVLYILAVGILVTVLVVGTTIRGTKGWFFFFGDQGFQPVEMVKIILIIMLSRAFAEWRAALTQFNRLIIACSLTLGLVALVLAQPDFGSALVLCAVFAGMLLLTTIKRSYLIMIVVGLCLMITLSWLFMLKDFQKERILTFLDPNRDPYGSGYNIKQSMIAIGSGTFFGRGLGLGPQSRLNFLPAQRTDFIFAVIAEELGFVGATVILLFCFLLVYRLMRIARYARDDFGLFTAYGITIYFVAQSVMNIGMNIGLLPVAGVPLPFVSYGGSSLLASYIAVGIAQSIRARQLEIMGREHR